MESKVQRWGNSLAVRIPKVFAEEAGLTEGTAIEVRLHRGGLLIEPSSVWNPTLDELVNGITADNRHDELDTGPAVGDEVW